MEFRLTSLTQQEHNVCNCIMYNALYLAAKKYLGVRAGFIHVPFENGQVVDKSQRYTIYVSGNDRKKDWNTELKRQLQLQMMFKKQWERPINVL